MSDYALAPPSQEKGHTAERPAAPSNTPQSKCSDWPSSSQRRRLPAFGRRIRANLLAGKRPKIGGGCVCIVSDWNIRTPLITMVCEPSVPMESWKLGFLAGVEVLLLVRGRDLAYGVALRDALLDAGCSLVSLHAVPEADHGL